MLGVEAARWLHAESESGVSKSMAPVRWVSNAPVQINVGRDLCIHGGASSMVDLPDDCVLPRGITESGFSAAVLRLWFAARLFGAAGWFLARMVFWASVALLVLAPLIAALLLSLGIWLLGRAAELLLWIEDKLGGGPAQLAYVPTLQHSRRDLSRIEGGELELEARMFGRGSGVWASEPSRQAHDA